MNCVFSQLHHTMKNNKKVFSYLSTLHVLLSALHVVSTCWLMNLICILTLTFSFRLVYFFSVRLCSLIANLAMWSLFVLKLSELC